MQLRLSLSLLLLSLQVSHARDLGTVSTTLSIKEQSPIEFIMKKLKAMEASGELDKLQKEIQNRAVKSVERPKSVEGISKANAYTVKSFGPSISLPEDIKDHKGTIIAKKGTIYNPLEETAFGDPLLFIDGDDEEQVKWSLSQKGKKVLVKGAPLGLAKEYKTHFYFDQAGVLVKKLGINSVPTKVSQKGEKLLIESFPVSNNGVQK